MQIIFTAARWKNFMLTGNTFIEIPLNVHSKTLIIGNNGLGKSTFVDAIYYGLFDETFRPKMLKSKLINSINLSNCLVEVEFDIGSRHYLVRRGMKPGIFEIYENGRMFDQDAANGDLQKYLETKILRCGANTFKQVVVLGAASFEPFMRLSHPKRREVVEDLLDIKIFSAMSKVLKKRIDDLKEWMEQTNTNQTLNTTKAEMLRKFIADTKRNSQRKAEEERQKLRDAIDEQDLKLADLESTITSAEETVTALNQEITDVVAVEERIKKLESYEDKAREKARTKKQKIKFYTDKTGCDQCGREISSEDREKIITEETAGLKELELGLKKMEAEIIKKQARLAEIAPISRKIAEQQRIITDCRNSASALRQYVKRLERDLAAVRDTITAETVEEEQQLAETEKEALKIEALKAQQLEEKHYYDIAALLLKDGGIKTIVIKQYLPIISKLINKYINDLDFFASFSMDETFNEVIKRRHLDETSYSALSLGQQKRIDLATLFAWRDIARMKNSVSTNILVLDEIADSSLDDVGIENFLKLLQDVSVNSNIFVISPKGGPLQDKFDHVITFVAENNFSKIKT